MVVAPILMIKGKEGRGARVGMSFDLFLTADTIRCSTPIGNILSPSNFRALCLATTHFKQYEALTAQGYDHN
jgi:hypothetical protein